MLAWHIGISKLLFRYLECVQWPQVCSNIFCMCFAKTMKLFNWLMQQMFVLNIWPSSCYTAIEQDAFFPPIFEKVPSLKIRILNYLFKINFACPFFYLRPFATPIKIWTCFGESMFLVECTTQADYLISFGRFVQPAGVSNTLAAVPWPPTGPR